MKSYIPIFGCTDYFIKLYDLTQIERTREDESAHKETDYTVSSSPQFKIIKDREAYEYRALWVNETASAKKPAVSEKQQAKQEAKKNNRPNLKFKRGAHYMLKTSKSCIKTDFVHPIYELKQIVHTINNVCVNIVVMKQINKGSVDNLSNTKFTLTENDCRLFHVKYEPGLEVFSSLLRWVRLNK